MTNQYARSPKLRLLSAVLAAALALTLLPAAAFAEDAVEYDLKFGGIQVTSANAGDLLRDGRVRYDDAARTLTLQGDIVVTDNAVNPSGEPLTVTGKSTVTGAQRDRYAGFYCGGKPIRVDADADITLDTFGFGINASGADIFGTMKIRNAEYGIGGMGVTIESGGRLVIEDADQAVSGGGAKVYGTLEIRDVKEAANSGGITVYEGGEVTIAGADSGLSGGSAVKGGILSVRAGTCIGNGAVTFAGGTLLLESTGGSPISLDEAHLLVQAAAFWYRTEKDGAWTSVPNGSWTRPSEAVYFEITTEAPAEHYTVTFDLNGGERWESIEGSGIGQWNDEHSRLHCTTSTDKTNQAEFLVAPLMKGMGPERQEYEFDGWYTAAIGGEPVEEQLYYEGDQRLSRITGDITLYAHWRWNGGETEPPTPEDPGFDDGAGSSGAGAALAVAGGAAAVGAVSLGVYELTTRAILKSLLPAGAAIPADRGALALLLWQNAGRPEPAARPAFADVPDADTASAAQWCVEQGLLTAEGGTFRPEQRVAKHRVIKVWKQAAAPQK